MKKYISNSVILNISPGDKENSIFINTYDGIYFTNIKFILTDHGIRGSFELIPTLRLFTPNKLNIKCIQSFINFKDKFYNKKK